MLLDTVGGERFDCPCAVLAYGGFSMKYCGWRRISTKRPISRITAGWRCCFPFWPFLSILRADVLSSVGISHRHQYPYPSDAPHCLSLPLGKIEQFGTGKLRRVIAETGGAAETYLAHQLPDKARALATTAGLLVLLLAFDWRLGLLSLVPWRLALPSWQR